MSMDSLNKVISAMVSWLDATVAVRNTIRMEIEKGRDVGPARGMVEELGALIAPLEQRITELRDTLPEKNFEVKIDVDLPLVVTVPATTPFRAENKAASLVWEYVNHILTELPGFMRTRPGSATGVNAWKIKEATEVGGSDDKQ